MRDRIPTKVLNNGAVRYAVYDENGALLRYEYMLPADEPADGGTPLSKGTIMTDDVEALIWGAAADRTPNDAFGKMSELYQHWWSVLHGEAYSYYEEVKTRLESRVNLTNRFAGAEYSSTLTVDKDTGELSLVNPKSLGYYGAAGTIESFCSTLANNAPCYLCITTTEKEKQYYYIPTGATYSTPNTDSAAPYTIIGGEYDDNLYIYLNAANVPSDLIASVVTSQRVDVPAGATTYEYSADRNAYPDSGTVDGLTYKYLGVPFENARTAARIEVVSYIGTGTYGSANPTSITLERMPKLLIYLGSTSCMYDAEYNKFPLLLWGVTGSIYFSGTSATAQQKVTYSGNTVSWAPSSGSGSAEAQGNTSGKTYRFIVFY